MKKAKILILTILFIASYSGFALDECDFCINIQDVNRQPVGNTIDDYREIEIKWKWEPVSPAGMLVPCAYVKVTSKGPSVEGHNNGAILQLEVFLGNERINVPVKKCNDWGYDLAIVEDEFCVNNVAPEDYPSLRIFAITQVWGCYTDGALVKYYEEFEKTFDLVIPDPSIEVPQVNFLCYVDHPKLTWNYQEDVHYYEIFREVKYQGQSSGWNLWGTTPLTYYLDTATMTSGKYFHIPSDNWIAYKVRAVDAFGNRSSFSIIGYFEILDTGGRLPPIY